MFDYLFGLILLGLGLQSPITGPAVKGDQTENVQEATEEAEIEEHTGTGSAKEVNKERRVKKFLPDNVRWLESDEREIHIASRSGRKDKHDTFREELRSKQEKFRLEFEVHKASAEARLQTKKEEFELKLAQFKDETKKTIIENIQQRLEEYNTKLTDRATENLAKISHLLDKVIEKAKSEKENGKDTTALDAAIASAQAAITSAQDAIADQASKSYVVPVSTEENAKTDTQSITKTLTSDAKVMHTAIVTARKSVSTAIRELAKVRGEPVPDAVIK